MQGFYSRYFLVPKKTGGLRPILDLALFNKYIVERPYHMLTIRRVFQWVKLGNWFTSIDLKDAYFRSHGGAAGAASHEAAAEMVFSPAHRPGAPTAAQIDHSPISGPRFDPLGRSPNPHERSAVGQSNVTHLSVHGCFSVGLGRNASFT